MLKRLKKELRTSIKHASNIYIIGHNYTDLDAFGAAIGISLIVSKLNKKSFIIMDDKVLEKGVNKALLGVKNKFNFIKSSSIKKEELINSLLIIVDTNKKHLVVESPHPSPFSAYNGFFGSKPFSKTNNYLIQNKKEPIDWSL